MQRLVCVLNGGFVKHKRKEKYKKSRGLISKEILKTNDFLGYIHEIDLENVEPFTMVIVDYWGSELHLFELVWDAHEKHFSKLKTEPKIWSSSTLYSNEINDQRKEWFHDWLDNNDFTSTNILKFHHAEMGDKSQTILMKRSYVETVSITTVKKESNSLDFLSISCFK